MKKLNYFLILIFFLSCAGLKTDPEPGIEVVLTGFDGINNVESIKVWQKPFEKGERPFLKVSPGTKVKLIKINGPMALIELPDGQQGWIQKIFVK
ncbi:MAG: hypothetical protein N2114_00855 [Candidatus Goldbacteria bacterium]|nr:hypothetical protein [Candidatus Goldiibacteriota bacterium]